jgi:putative ABC transport system permease protein
MIKQYIKQAFFQLRSQPLLSSISIIGTVLAICLIMTIVLMQQIQTEPFAPESNRNRMLHVKWMTCIQKGGTADNAISNGPMSITTARECFRALTTPEAVTIYSIVHKMKVSIPKGKGFAIDIKQTDEQFFRVFDFAFVNGKPFDKASSEAGLPVAVINESVARAVYATTAVVGRQINLNHAPYKICGVVRDVTTLASNAYAQVWVPYRSTDIDGMSWYNNIMGVMHVSILAHSNDDFPTIRAECERLRLKYNAGLRNDDIVYRNQPDTQEVNVERKRASSSPDMRMIYNKRFLVFAILLLIPAINLSSMTQSRLRKRVVEIGVRRSFGSTRKDVMWQVLAENLILTLIAGIIGLILCFVFAFVFSSSVFSSSSIIRLNSSPSVDVMMLMHFSTFGYALFFCLLMNLLSSGIPAWKASRISITDALSNN